MLVNLRGMALFVLCGLPFLLGYGIMPQPNFINEITAVAGFGLLLIIASQRLESQPKTRLYYALVFWFAFLFITAFVRNLDELTSRFWTVRVVQLSYLFFVPVAIHLGWCVGSTAQAERWFVQICTAFLIAGIFIVGANTCQYFNILNNWALIPYIVDAGRAYGFIRQPNHTAMLLVLAIHAAIWFYLTNRTSAIIFGALVFLFGAAILMTGSRTGLVMALFSLVWLNINHAFDKKRVLLTLALFSFLIAAAAILAWLQQHSAVQFYATQKLNQSLYEGLGMRTILWQEAFRLIMEHPWMGWGTGKFIVVFFLSGAILKTGVLMSNAHNIFLQLAFDFGLPIAVLTGLIIFTVFWSSRKRIFQDQIQHAIFGMLICLLIHSMLEFPLWYMYFLIPASLLMGILAGRQSQEVLPETSSVRALSDQRAEDSSAIKKTQSVLTFLGLIIVGAALWANSDFYKVAPIFRGIPANTLAQHLEESRGVSWFSQYSEYAQSILPMEITPANAQEHLQKMQKLGCIMPEALYQGTTIAALGYVNRVDVAKQMIYIYWRMSGGKIDHFEKALVGKKGVAFEEINRYLANPYPVPLTPEAALPCLK